MGRFTLDRTAKFDLRQISKYISEEQNRPEAARKLATKTQRDCQKYAKNPLMGELRGDLFPALRQFTIRPYVVFYIPDGDGIRILRIVHGARDFPNLFA